MYTWYPFSNITPADDNSLQAWDYTELVTGDKAIGEIEAGIVVPFKYDSTSSATEDLPNVITPDGNAGNGRWLRIEVDTGQNLFNGTFEESFNALVTSDGATVTMALAKDGGGNLTAHFSSGHYTHTAGNIALTAGSDAAPQVNYIYILESDPTTLVKNTSSWPATEHIKVGFFFVPSAGYVQTYGCYINQNWNDHHQNSNGMGHLAHIGEVIRLTMEGARWHSGVGGNGSDDFIDITINGGSADNVYFKTAAGACYQMHRHTVPAIDTGAADTILVVNDSVTAYDDIQDIAGKLLDSLGASMSGKYFNMVFWAVANKSGEHAPLMMNLPSGSYNSLASATNDVSGFDVYDIPREFKNDSSVAFLVARVTFKHAVAGSGTWTVENTTDLRGRTPGTASGIGGGGSVTFADNQFKIYNVSDITKLIDFDLSGLTSPSTRTVTPADADMTILSTVNHDDLTDGGVTILHKHGGLSDGEIYREILEGSAFRKATLDPCENLTTYGSFAGASTTDGISFTFAAADVWTGTSFDESTWSGTHTKAMLVMDYTGSGTFELSADGGANWETVTENQVHTFTNTGTDLRVRITNVSNLVVYSYGVLYDIDDQAISLSDTETIIGVKNMIINGDMKVAQRSTSVAGVVASGYITLDRFRYSENGTTDGAVTLSQDTDAPAGFGNSYKIDVTTVETLGAANASIRAIHQKIEGQNLQHLKWGTADAKDITLSFWFKSDTKTGDLGFVLNQPQRSSDNHFAHLFTISDNNWNKYSLTIPGDTSGVIDDDNLEGLGIHFSLVAGGDVDTNTPDTWSSGSYGVIGQDNWYDHTDNNLWFTGIQLEVGQKANEFDHRSYAEELNLCMRYYERWTTDDTSNNLEIASGFVNNTTSAWLNFHYLVTKRAVPSVVGFEDGADWFILHKSSTATATTAIGTNNIGVNSTLLNASVAAGLTGGEGCSLRSAGSGEWIEMDAEL